MVAETRTSRSSSVLLGFLRGGAVPTLSLMVLALVVVFGLVLGERIVSVGALQSMAFQLPELGILSLAMMVTLLSGGLNLSIIATANLCALTMAWVLTTLRARRARLHVGRLASDRGARGRRRRE